MEPNAVDIRYDSCFCSEFNFAYCLTKAKWTRLNLLAKEKTTMQVTSTAKGVMRKMGRMMMMIIND
jgi:hypothetical protein